LRRRIALLVKRVVRRRRLGAGGSRCRGGVDSGDSAELRYDLMLIESEEGLLIRPHLMNVYVVEAGLGVFLNLREMPLRIGSAKDSIRDPHLVEKLYGLLKMLRQC
jgi:hypothetical protein